MSAATPGAWYASALRTHGADPSKNGCDIGAENGANIAIALHQPEDRSEQETIGNARLIAAAPDLLEAAKLVLAWYEVESDHSKQPDFYKRVVMCTVSEDAIRAAIVKATGAQQ